MPRLALALVALAAGCAVDHMATGDAGRLEFNIAGIPFVIASGGSRIEGTTLDLYLSDQPDTCLVTSQRPVGRTTILSLFVIPAADGTTAATITPNASSLAPGQASASLLVQVGGQKTGGADASDGTVTWTANADGSTTITAVDLGFAGTSDRLQTGGLTVPACP